VTHRRSWAMAGTAAAKGVAMAAVATVGEAATAAAAVGFGTVRRCPFRDGPQIIEKIDTRVRTRPPGSGSRRLNIRGWLYLGNFSPGGRCATGGGGARGSNRGGNPGGGILRLNQGELVTNMFSLSISEDKEFWRTTLAFQAGLDDAKERHSQVREHSCRLGCV
jgi:hypothetical protein